MKIKQILLKNFATVNEIQIDLNDDITYLVGENGAGKTMCGLNAIWFILEGIAKTGKKVLHADRFRFIGKYGKSAVGQITLYDEKEDIEIYLQRKITKGATSLHVAASDGRDLGDNFVDKIFNIFSINPEGFAQLSPREQATALGVDVSAIDERKKKVYDERRELGYAVKQTSGALDECSNIEKVDHVDVQALMIEKAEIDRSNAILTKRAMEERENLYNKAVAHNKVQDALRSEVAKQKNGIEMLESKLILLRAEVESTERKLGISKTELLNMPVPLTSVDVNIPMPLLNLNDGADVARRIEHAIEQNKQADAWDKFLDIRNRHSKAVAEHDKKQCEYNAIEQERIDYLKSRKLPFGNITINDSGELLVDGRPFSSPYFSKGEILRAGIKMAAATSPELKYIFVPDAQSIDEKSREILFKELTDAGFQVVAEMVGTKKREGDASILLRESQVVDSYEDTKSVL